MRTSEELRSEIEERLGFLPPFFGPALEVPAVVESLWQQTLAGYVENPLPALFKEKLFAYLSRSCAVPYCVVCHSCALRPLGMKAGEVLELLEQPAPEGQELLDHLAILRTEAGPLGTWPEPGSRLDEALLAVATAAFLGSGESPTVGQELRRLLGVPSYQDLTVLLGYVKACHLWVEAHPGLCHDEDRRAREHLGPLIAEEPRLGEFFRTYRERVHAEREARQRSEPESERRDRLAAIIEASEDAILTTTAEGIVTSWNAGAERLYGYASEEIIGHPVWTLIGPDRLAEVQEAFGRLRVGERVAYESARVRKDGTPVEVWITASPIRDSVGRVVAVSAIVRDITERKRAEAALRVARAEAEAAREEAEGASRAKSEFLSRMSHELRTPLNAILGFAQLLAMEGLGSERSESVGQILRAGRHLLHLIDEVLDVARIEQGRLSLVVEPVHLGEVVREALDLIRPLAAPGHIHIRSEASPFDRHLLADRQRLKQVVMNLLSNAVKYNRPGGAVTVSCRPTREGRVRIGVADTGPGIPPESMDRLFLPFERLGAEQTPVEGTGIGLSISKRLVELMGGEIGAESEVGRGSTFWVELDPVEAPEEHEAPVAEEAAAVPAAADGGRTVLYVEDNLANLRLVERILARRPAVRLVAAMQGGLALELAREHRPELILLDVHLPDIDGDEVLRRLRADAGTSAIPVVVVSAEATAPKIERFLAAGARAYLTKPLDVKRFLEVIDETLGEPPR